MYLFIYEGFRGGPDRQAQTDELVIRAATAFVAEKGIDMKNISWEICRTDKGKPYFAEIPLEFSVSHTDDMWVCLVSEENLPVGVDIQKIKETRQQRVADRYFTSDEIEYLNENGTDAFFEIWTRKEAYAKYTGKGLSKELSGVSTLDNKYVRFVSFDVRTDIKGACCVKEKGDLCLRTI